MAQGRGVPLRFTLAPGFHIARLWRFVPTHWRAFGALFRLIYAPLALCSDLFARLWRSVPTYLRAFGAQFRLICAPLALCSDSFVRLWRSFGLICAKPSLFAAIVIDARAGKRFRLFVPGGVQDVNELRAWNRNNLQIFLGDELFQSALSFNHGLMDVFFKQTPTGYAFETVSRLRIA